MSLFVILCYAILGGLILNIMPCVLPVVGLKLMSFVKQAGKNGYEVLILNLSYIIGVMFIFFILATLACLTQLGLSTIDYNWGELYTLTWFKVLMTIFVFVMGLSLLGYWELPIPGFAISDTSTKLSAQEGLSGSFFLGCISTLLATPCSGPFLGPVFGYTLGQPIYVTYAIFLSIGFGMSLPYLILGMFPEMIGFLPKPGMWMEKLKKISGVLLILTSVWLLSTFLEFNIDNTNISWQTYSEELLEKSINDKIVMLEFTSKVCLTCKTNAEFVINTKEIGQVVKNLNIVCLSAHLEDGAHVKEKLMSLGYRAVPLIVIYHPNKEPIYLPDMITKKQLIKGLTND